MYNYLTEISYRNSDDDEQYRKELLKCFNLESYSDEIINRIYILYDLVKEYYSDVIKELKKHNNFENIILCFGNNDKTYFNILFSWDFFFENHQLLRSIHLKEKINESKELLIKRINNMDNK